MKRLLLAFALAGSMVAAAERIPVIHTTDLFVPPADPDDYFDLAMLYAMPEFDVRAVIFDFPHELGQEPGFTAVEALNKITGRKVPMAASPGTDLFLLALGAAPAKVVVTVMGSARTLALALKQNPALVKSKVRMVLLNAGSAQELDELEYNVNLDPGAYAEVLNSGLPVYWYPCATPGKNKIGAFNYGPNNTFFQMAQTELEKGLSTALAEWLPGDGQRNLWSTASLMMAAGRVLKKTPQGWRFVPGKTSEIKMTMRPVQVTASANGRTSWKPAAKSNIYLFERELPPGYDAAMGEALNALLKTLAR